MKKFEVEVNNDKVNADTINTAIREHIEDFRNNSVTVTEVETFPKYLKNSISVFKIHKRIEGDQYSYGWISIGAGQNSLQCHVEDFKDYKPSTEQEWNDAVQKLAKKLLE